jgi:hypothetical protein
MFHTRLALDGTGRRLWRLPLIVSVGAAKADEATTHIRPTMKKLPEIIPEALTRTTSVREKRNPISILPLSDVARSS